MQVAEYFRTGRLWPPSRYLKRMSARCGPVFACWESIGVTIPLRIEIQLQSL